MFISSKRRGTGPMGTYFNTAEQVLYGWRIQIQSQLLTLDSAGKTQLANNYFEFLEIN